MEWFFKTVRIAGASFPGASSLVQLQAELDYIKMEERITKLTDPISYLHDDIQEISKIIYLKLKELDSQTLDFDEQFYEKYSRALASLESQNYIKGQHIIGKQFKFGISLIDPSFIMYMCVLAEDNNKMESLTKAVDSCEVGKSLKGELLKSELGLPIEVIRAIFEIYSSKGYGLVSKEVGSAVYIGKA